MTTATVQFELLSPERRLARLEAAEVQIPGADGDLTVMAGHAPLVVALRPGVVHVVVSEGRESYAVVDGFAEITGNSVAVLAERTVAMADADAGFWDGALAAVRNSSAADPDMAAKAAADIEALRKGTRG